MAERIFGIETEYALSAIGPDGVRADQDRALARFMDVARRTLIHLPDHSSNGMFLQNGSRFYVDAGRHPELATCEVLNPWDSCRYVLAGECILGGLAEQAAAEDPALGEILLARCNVCYSPDRATTWGCHESYGHRVLPAQLRDQLIPHLVSRIIYTGAGGFNNRFPGIRFTISPRVPHLENVASDASTGSRGIYHTKDETLSSDGYHRLHVLCGESVCSQTSLWLKTAVTTLVVAMIEAGLNPCAAIRLHDPLAAMQRFAVDVEMTATAESIDGRPWTALGMQRHILQQIETHAGHRIMPAWTPQVIERLRHVLDRLERGPAEVATILDWAIKLALYREFARKRGISWESLGHWNEVLARRYPPEPPADPLELASRTLARSLARGRPETGDTSNTAVLPEEEGIDPKQFREVVSLRQRLFELDTRFGQLGPRSVFDALHRAGALQHTVPGVDNIEHAVLNPPATGRAHVRGECVRRFDRQRDRFHCDWMAIWDCQQDQYLDLSDPFANEEHWHQARQRRPEAARSALDILRRTLNDARRFYEQGRYEQAYRALGSVRLVQGYLDVDARREWLRLRAWVACRRGFFDGVALLDELARDHRDTLWLTSDYISTYRFAGLVPRPETAGWIQTGEDFFRRHPDQRPDRFACFYEHQGYFLMTEGRLEEARDVLQSACAAPRPAQLDTRILSRAMAVLGEVNRRLGNREEAAHLLETAMAEQAAHEFFGDQAGFSWTYLAKLRAGSVIARQLLARTKATQLELQDRMGEARTLLLEARLADDTRLTGPLRHRLLELKEQVPALSQCRVLAKVLDHWDQWVGNLAPDETGDLFWRV